MSRFAVALVAVAVALGGCARQETAPVVGASASAASPPPPPAPAVVVLEGGVEMARLDVEGLTAWCAEQGLPAPPRMEIAEQQVAQSVVDALAAAATRTASALGHAGMVMTSLDANDAALEYLALAATADPQEPLWPYHSGCVLQELGRDAEAIVALERSLELDPDYPMTWARLGHLYVETGRTEDATRFFQHYATARPEDWLGQVYLARIELDGGRPQRALEYLETAAARQSEDFQVQFFLGQTHLALGNRQLAASHMEHATRLPKGLWFKRRDPRAMAVDEATNSVQTLVDRLERNLGSGDHAALAALAAEIIRRRPDDFLMMGNLASLQRKLGDLALAHETLKRAQELAPDSFSLLVTEAELYLSEQRLAEAHGVASRALEIAPDDGRALDIRGRAAYLLSRFGEAAQDLHRSVAVDPHAAPGVLASRHYVLGEALRRLGDEAGAVRNFERALELAPGYAPARQALAQ